MIQHKYNRVFIPSQPLRIDLINNIKLYHGSQPTTHVVFYHGSKARNRIYNCIDFKSKLVIIDLIQHNTIENDSNEISKKVSSIV